MKPNQKAADHENLKFLESSELCDLTNPLIKRAASRIVEKSQTREDVAVKTFYFVRDKISLALVRPWKTASETLKIGKGSCLTKATLQVALLRAAGIPARFRIMEFKGNDPEEWEGILPSFAVSKMPERWPHYFAEVFVERRWVMADATFDKALIPATEDWDGERDVCSISDKAVLHDAGAFAFIEEEARKLDEKYRAPAIWRVNGYRLFWIINLYQKVQRLKNRPKVGARGLDD